MIDRAETSHPHRLPEKLRFEGEVGSVERAWMRKLDWGSMKISIWKPPDYSPSIPTDPWLSIKIQCFERRISSSFHGVFNR